MKVNDTARVRHPLSAVEYRLATIVSVEAQPGGKPGDRYRLRFSSGDERSYAPPRSPRGPATTTVTP